LASETDVAARRNAFLMLMNENEDLAIDFLANNMDDVGSLVTALSCSAELTRLSVAVIPRKSRGSFVSSSDAFFRRHRFLYEAACDFVSLSSLTAVRASALTYTNLLNGQNDYNVKLIVLERLEALKRSIPIVQELLMDILRALASPSPDICKASLKWPWTSSRPATSRKSSTS
jgi:coatomer subunit beta